jgi:hypothetical protein|tara:strand:+ start:146 stop:340 length:195 start_codon:yes stop_codon:yes gene_type:complete
MGKKHMIFQSILWATAMLVTVISNSIELTIFLLIILGSCSVLFMKKKLNEIEKINQAVDGFERK